MKPTHFIPPCLAIAASVAWISSQQASISELQTDIQTHQRWIDAGSPTHLAVNDDSSSSSTSSKKPANDSGIDWERMAKLVSSMETGGMPDMEAMMEMQEKLYSLSGDELLAALDEIAALDLSDKSRERLEGMMIQMMAQKEPKLTLEKFAHRLKEPEGSYSWALSTAMGAWVADDPVAATNWMDEKLAAGFFESTALDGKNEVRIRFESSILGGLISTDPAAAKARILALSEEQRKEVMNNTWLMKVKTESQKDYAELVRETLNDKEGAEVLANFASYLGQVRGDYKKVDEYIERIEASDGERSKIVEKSARNIFEQKTRNSGFEEESVIEMRDWLDKSGSEETDKITGEAVASFWNDGVSFEDRAKVITSLKEEGASDDLIVSFVEQSHSAKPEQVSALIELIEDEAVRTKLKESKGKQPSISTSPASVEFRAVEVE